MVVFLDWTDVIIIGIVLIIVKTVASAALYSYRRWHDE